MAKAKKLPSGNWRVRAYAGKDAEGKALYKSFTETTERKANLAALEWQERYKEISQDSSQMTVEEAIESYIKLKENLLSPATIKGYNSIKQHRLKSLMPLRLCKLTQNNIQEAINQEAKTLSAKTVRNVHGLLSAVLAQYRPEWRIPKFTLPQKETPKGKALTKPQIALLINNLDGEKMELPILLALWLGLRRSEILALKWEDIDFEKNTITINQAAVYDINSKLVIKGTKTTGSNRILRMPGYIKSKLEAKGPGEGRIFDIYTNAPIRAFQRICKKLNIGEYTFHDLRRSMATVGLSLNIADKLIMSRGGWSNTKTMKNIYQVVLQDDIDSADVAINNYFESLINNNVT